MKRISRSLTMLVLLLALAGLLHWPQAAANAAREGLALCGGVVVPALFPFFVLTSLAVSLGMAQLLGAALAPALGPLFRVSRAGVGALTLSLVGGYPVGAGAVRQLYQEGQCSRNEAERLLAFCNNCGPAFLLGAAGAGVFGSTQAGLLLLAGHWLGACSVGVLFRFSGEVPRQTAVPAPIQSVSLAAAFTGAVKSAVQSTLNVCGSVVLFRVLLELLSLTGLLDRCAALPNGQALAWGLLELTSGVNALEPGRGFTGAMVCGAFLMAFGGLSVQCQTLALLEGSGLNLRPALVGKMIHGGFAALWTWLLLGLFPLSVTTMVGSLPRAKLGMAPSGRHRRGLGGVPAGAGVVWQKETFSVGAALAIRGHFRSCASPCRRPRPELGFSGGYAHAPTGAWKMHPCRFLLHLSASLARLNRRSLKTQWKNRRKACIIGTRTIEHEERNCICCFARTWNPAAPTVGTAKR